MTKSRLLGSVPSRWNFYCHKARFYLATICNASEQSLTHKVVDVGRGQPERLDLAELGVAGDVGNAVPQVGESVVDGLRPSAFLLVAAALAPAAVGAKNAALASARR